MNILPIQTFSGEVMIPLSYFDEPAELEMIVRDGFAIVRSKRSIPTYHVNARRGEMLQQVRAFEAQHAYLVEHHLGEYIAIMNGKLIDHDREHYALRQRIDQQYQDATILVRRVEENLPSSLHAPFPRFVD